MNEFARITDYFGPWCIEPKRMAECVAFARSLDLRQHIQNAVTIGNDGLSADSEINGSIATINLRGPMMKFVNSLDTEGASTVAVRRALRAADAAKEVKAIALVIDSPGGTAAGTADLADDVAKIAKRKPVYVYAEDLLASAAYWVASQATEIIGNPTLFAGSIGTYMVVRDYSESLESAGIKTHVIRAGDFKGAGTTGERITDEQLAEWQSLVTKINEQFLSAVERGREMKRLEVDALADGRLWIADDARQRGLIDGVMTRDEFFQYVSDRVDNSTATREVEMSTANTAQVAAENVDQLRSELRTESAKFVEAFGDVGATWFLQGRDLLDCYQEHVQQLRAEIAARNEKIEALQAAANEQQERLDAAIRAAGDDPIPSQPASEAAPKPLVRWRHKN